MIKKAFILGAGLGTRLRPLTNVLPKPLVPIFNEPMANYALRHCQAAGISSFAINTHHIPEAWQEAYPTGEFEGSSIEFFNEETLLETGGGIRNIASFIGSDPLLIYNGDILTDINITELIEKHEASGNIATLALRSSGENCNVSIVADQVTDMRNTLGDTEGTHQFTGIYCIDPEILKLIASAEEQLVISIVPAFIELIKQGKLGAVVLDEGYWLDIGNPIAYREAHDHLRQTRKNRLAAIHPSAKIHPDTIVNDATCIIGAEANIPSGAQLENTIVWANASLDENKVYRDEIITGRT
ncbi:MAG: sugar phosphate nucleotidyltransferase [Akkermansiaceae bacterium]